jgi:hypothetical protein
MKSKYQNRLIQYEAFISFCKKEEATLKKLRGFSLNFTQFKIRYAIIWVAWQQYMLLINGSGPGIEELKKSLCLLAATINEAIADNQPMSQKKLHSAEELATLKNDKLVTACQKIYRQVVQRPGVFSQTSNVLEIRNTFTGAIDMYNAAITPPRVQKTYLTFMRQRLDKLLVEAEAMLKTEMEPIIKKVKLKHPQVYSQYAFIKKLKQGERPRKLYFVNESP